MHYAKTTAIAVAALAAGADATIVAPMADTYLQSDGTQAIDTGYYASDKTKVVIDFEPTQTNDNRYVFGAADPGNGLALSLVQAATKFTLQMVGSKNFTPVPLPAMTRYTAAFDCAAVTASLAKYAETPFAETASYSGSPIAAATNSLSIAILARHVSGGYGQPFIGKLYSMQIYDGETLVRDFIPYGRGAVTGLYDRVNGKVYEKAQGNPFVIGTEDAYVRGSESSPAYVNTGVTPTAGTKVEIDFAMMSATANSRVFGNLGGSSFSMDVHVDKNGSGNFFYSMQDGNTGGYTTSVPVGAERHIFALSADEALLTSDNGAVTNFLNTSLQGTRTKAANGPMVVFGASNSANPVSGSQFPCDVKVYGMKIWENGVLVRNFTPRMVAGEFGFWDSVNSEFHGKNNANPLRGGGSIESDADPIPSFTVNPQSGEVRVKRTLTLTASAPGATHYQWFLDGKMLEGATGPAFDVEWTEDETLVRRYRCLAFFDVFGYAESDEAVVRNTPAGTIIYMR